MARVFTPDERKQILIQAQEFWRASSAMMQPFFNDVNDYERMWRVQLPKDLEAKFQEIKDRAALAPPDININIKSLRASLGKILFGRKPIVQLSLPDQPNVRNETVEKAEARAQANFDMHSDGNGFEHHADSVLTQVLVAGRTACFTKWTRKYEPSVVRNPETQQIQTDESGNIKREMKLVAEYPETVDVDIRRVRIDPAAGKVTNFRIIGLQSSMPLTDLLVKNRDPNSGYEFDEKELEKTTFNRSSYYEYVNAEAAAYSQKGVENRGFGDKMVEEWDIRGLFQFKQPDGTIKREDLIVKVGNQQMLLAVKENDLPLYGWELFDFPQIEAEAREFFTMGAVEPIMDTWIEKFIKRNQSLDESGNRTYDTYIGDKSACRDLPEVIERIPNQILLVDTLAAGKQSVQDVFQPVIRPALGQDTFRQAESLSGDMQKGMGLSDYIQGLDPGRAETATGIDSLVSGGMANLEFICKRLAATYIIPVTRKQMILWNFFMGDKDSTVATADGRTFDIRPGEINIPFRVSIDINTAMERSSMVRRFTEGLPLMLQDPYFDPRKVRELWINVHKLPGGNSLLKNDEVLQMTIMRENAALMHGIELPVHPMDEHEAHLTGVGGQGGHISLIDYINNLPPNSPDAQQVTLEAVEKHIAAHQAEIEKMNAALTNTRDSGGAAAKGGPENAASKQFVGRSGVRSSR